MRFYKKFKASLASIIASLFIIFFAIYYQGVKQNAWDVVAKLFLFVCSPLNLVAFSFDWPRYLFFFKKQKKYQQLKDLWLLVLIAIGLIAAFLNYLGYL